MIERLKRIDTTVLLFILVMTTMLAFPFYVLLYRYMPSLIIPIGENGIRVDQIILFSVIFVILFFVIKRFRKTFSFLSIIGLGVFVILNFSGLFTIEDLYLSYNRILYNLGDESLEKRFFIRNEVFDKEKELRNAVDYNNPDVVSFARNKATSNFQEYQGLIRDRRIIQYFSIFKEIHSRWIYVFDPIGEDFYSKASETIKQMEYNDRFKGDCDDYSIFMAACIRAVGGEVNLVVTSITRPDGTTYGHMYPEVNIGNKKDLDNIAHIMRNVLFPNEIGTRPIRYYQDPKGDVWLNFDYNDKYPGGRYQSDVRVSEIRI
jgi:hypothetical protein